MTEAPGVDDWKQHTTAFDRVQSVATTVSDPKSAADIADEAHVAENTAREHLERLAEMNVLLKTDDQGTTLYAPDPLHTRMQTLRELLDAHDHDGLLALKVDLQAQIETWQAEYDVDSPTALRTQAAAVDPAGCPRVGTGCVPPGHRRRRYRELRDVYASRSHVDRADGNRPVRTGRS